jgi:folate-binding protein YgfZ
MQVVAPRATIVIHTVKILPEPQSLSCNINLSIHRYNQVYAEFSLPSAMTPATHSDINAPTATSSASQLAALLNGAGISPLDNTGWIRATGEDRVRWLNGMVTNSIQDLKPGNGCYNFVLSVQGRIQGDAYIFAEPDALLIETASTQVPGLMALLDRFIIMDDVELADVSSARTGIAVSGPQAASFLKDIGLPVEQLGELEMRTIAWNATSLSVIRAYSPLVPHFEIWTDSTTAAALSQALLSTGAILCEPQSREWLRLLEGTPLYGRDIRDRELPQETAQTRALHFAKGCYLGQEIVERIRSRGNVHRTFAAFRLEGRLPDAGSTLEADGKQIGELTSVAAIPLSKDASKTVQLALGYIRREALDRAAPLLYTGGVAVPVSLPYSTAEATGLQAASEPSERV